MTKAEQKQVLAAGEWVFATVRKKWNNASPATRLGMTRSTPPSVPIKMRDVFDAQCDELRHGLVAEWCHNREGAKA